MNRRLLVLLPILTALPLPALRAQTLATPIALTGFTHDLIVGTTETTGGATSPTELGGFVFYESGVTTSSFSFSPPLTQGLPDAGANRTFTDAADSSVQFQFAPYTSPNADYIDFATNASRQLTLVSPGSFQDLHVLATGLSGADFDVTLNFSDSSSTIAGPFQVSDWTNSTGTNALFNMGLLGNGGYAGNLYVRDIYVTLSPADQAKTLNSITIVPTSFQPNGALVVFGASGTVSAIPEPSAGAAIFGALALLGAVGMREHRKRRTIEGGGA